MRPQGDGVHFMLALVTDPFFDNVVGEDSATQQKVLAQAIFPSTGLKISLLVSLRSLCDALRTRSSIG